MKLERLPATDRGAHFSPDRTHRYLLWWLWDRSKPVVSFTLLNGSSADEQDSDATVTRLRKRAEGLGFGGLFVTNAYGYVATDPADLKKAGFPVGEENDYFIVAAAKLAELVVCGWGQHVQKSRSIAILRMITTKTTRRPHALSFTKSGEPGHPLYLPYEGCPPMRITAPNYCPGCGFEIAGDSEACGECTCEDDCAPD